MKEINQEAREFVQNYITQMHTKGISVSIEKINSELAKFINRKNNESIDNFEGYSRSEMRQIVYYPFEKDSPIQIQ